MKPVMAMWPNELRRAFVSRPLDQRKKRTNGSKNIFVRKTLCETTPSSVSAKWTKRITTAARPCGVSKT
jgi:hypothetical protein